MPAPDADSAMPTPLEIARWMVAKLEENDILLQVEIVAEIEELFGPDYVYFSDYGEKSIDRRILYQFRKLTADDVVWITRHGGVFWSGAHWRRREPGDDSGRVQYVY